MGGANVWADNVSYKLFGSKWNATCDGVSTNWTSIAEANNYNTDVQVTTKYSGACANSPISFENIKSVTIHYHTNKTKGVGTISIYGVEQTSSAAKSGTQIGSTFTVKKPSSGGDASKSKTFTPSTSVSGYVQIYVTCSANSIFIESVDIEYEPASSVKYDVSWNVNGEVYTKGEPSIKVSEGQKVSTLPTAPEAINGKSFMGWTDVALSAAQDVKPAILFTDATDAPKVTGDVTYYAVFANKTGDGEVKYTKLTSNKFKTDATYVIGAESKKTGSIDYFYKYENVNTDCWGKMTSDLSVNSPIVFVLSGTADKLMAKDNNGNYLKCVSKNFQMSSTEASIKLNTDGTLLDVTGESYWLRYNSDSDYGLRWYAKDKTIGNLAYFYEVSGGYSYSGYCTTVGAATEPTYTSKNLTFVAHEGKDYYATFSNAKVVFMPATVVPMAVVVDATGKISEKDVFTPVTVTIGAKSEEGYYIPAETGVLLWTDKTSVEYYTVDNYAVDALAADANMLKPSVTAGAFVPETDYMYYKLAYGDWTNKTQLGFYWGAEDGGAFYVKAGTAYLAVPETVAAGAKGFAFNGEATGIEGVNANVENAKAIYNLNGQRVATMAKPGLYIVNGKKVVRK